MKFCSKCGFDKETEKFAIDRSRADGRSYICKDCRRTGTRPGPAKHVRTQRRAEGFGWCAGCQAWLPLEKIKNSRCRTHSSKYERDRYASDPLYRAERRQHARARKRGIAPIPAHAVETVRMLFGGECAYCLADATGFDHIEPVSEGGRTEPCNMVPACTSCNSSKNASNVWEWIEKTGRDLPAHKAEQIAFMQEDMPRA